MAFNLFSKYDIYKDEDIDKTRIRKAYNSINFLLFIIVVLIIGVFVINSFGDLSLWKDDSNISEELILKKTKFKEEYQKSKKATLNLHILEQNMQELSDTLSTLSYDSKTLKELIDKTGNKKPSNDTLIAMLSVFRKNVVKAYFNQSFSLKFYKQNMREYLDGPYTSFNNENFANSEDHRKYIEELINTQFFTSTNWFLTNEFPSDVHYLSMLDSAAFFRNNIAETSNIINSAVGKVSSLKKEIAVAQVNSTEEINKIEKQLENLNKTNLRKILAKFVLPFYGIIALLLLLIPYIYKKMFNESTSNEVILKIFDKNLLLKIFAVFILTATILILGIGDIIEENVLGTLLGGISVYVLQSSMGKSDAPTGNNGNGNNNPTNPVKPPVNNITEGDVNEINDVVE